MWVHLSSTSNPCDYSMKNSSLIIPLRKTCLYFIMYLASWSKCLFRINSLFLIETSSHKCFLTSISNIFYLANPFGRYHILVFWFEYYIPNIILVFFHHNILHEFVLSDHQHILVFYIQLWRLEPKSIDPSGSCPSCCTMLNSDLFFSYSPWSRASSSLCIMYRSDM